MRAVPQQRLVQILSGNDLQSFCAYINIHELAGIQSNALNVLKAKYDGENSDFYLFESFIRKLDLWRHEWLHLFVGQRNADIGASYIHPSHHIFDCWQAADENFIDITPHFKLIESRSQGDQRQITPPAPRVLSNCSPSRSRRTVAKSNRSSQLQIVVSCTCAKRIVAGRSIVDTDQKSELKLCLNLFSTAHIEDAKDRYCRLSTTHFAFNEMAEDARNLS